MGANYYDYEFRFGFEGLVKTNEKVEELSPEESPFKLAKSLDVSAILIREKDDDESPTGKTILTYERKFKVKVRDEAINVWLTRQNGFVFVKDLMKMFTYRFDLQTDELVTCSKISEKRISNDEAKTIDTGYVFSKYEKIDNDTEIYGRFVKPSQ